MTHDHGHHHHPPPLDHTRAFAIGIALNVAYILVEVVYGVMVNSLSLLADAGHNLSDVLGLLIAWGGHYLSQKPPTERRTYGLRSSSILAALLNALILLMAIGGIVWEAIRRLADPQPVAGETVMWVAGLGVLINTGTALLFLRGREHDLNIRGAFLHMAADAGVSGGVVLAGLVISLTSMSWIDPMMSLLVAAVIFWGTWGLLRESLDLALQAVPKSIDPSAVAGYLRNLPGVAEIHDLHIWPMSTTETALTAHLIKPSLDCACDDEFLAQASSELREQFGIAHTTLQLERRCDPCICRQAPADTV